MNIGIIGAGKIARKMANTVNALDGFNAYAIASRSLEKAITFKEEYHFEKAFGSYEDLVKDPDVDLVYIATPHSEHYKNMLLCLKYKKPVICEKILTTSSKQTEEIYGLFEQNNVFLLEAMWCAFMPLRDIINSLLNEKIIGDVVRMEGYFKRSLMHVERVKNRSLGGGAAMDIGLYPISFALRTFGFNPDKIEVKELRKNNDVDEYEVVEMIYGNIKAISIADASVDGDCDIRIFGSKGKIIIDKVTGAKSISVFDLDNNLIRVIDCECPLGGFEYELIASRKAIEDNKLETAQWTHENSIKLARIIDKIVYSD